MSLRTARRLYSTQRHLSVTGMSPSASTALLVENHIAPHSHQQTLVRTRSELQASVLVNAPGFDIPPEFWWGQTFVYLTAFWVPSNSNTLKPAAGSDVGYLGSVTLKPRRYPIETNPGEYVVIWNSEEPLVTQTNRQSPTATTGPNVLFQAEVDDPQFVFSNTYADVSINFAVRAASFWLDP